MNGLVFATAVLIAMVPGTALSQGSGTQPGHTQIGAPVPPEFLKPLPEINGVVSWKTLAQVQPVKVKDRFVPQFAESVLELNATEVKLQGFMMPLEMGDAQKHFVLSQKPVTCASCLPGGAEALVEVRARTGVKYTFEPVILSGKLEVLRDDPSGVFYRLTDAVRIAAK